MTTPKDPRSNVLIPDPNNLSLNINCKIMLLSANHSF